jgi:hypothetical protein
MPPISSQAIQFLRMSGNLALTSIGETSQLTVVATLRDSTTVDVTAGCGWQSTHVTTATVSPIGLLTATGFGVSEVSCGYSGHYAVKAITATPPGTFAIGGRVSEPDDSDFYLYPLANALVVDTASGRSAVTNPLGKFSMGNLSASTTHLRITREGYEPSETNVSEGLAELPLQPVVRLTAGDTVSPWLVGSHELAYVVDGRTCYPCRLIRVVVPQPATLRVRVTWEAPTSALTLFAEGQVVTGTNDVAAELQVDTPREVIVYVGGASPKAVSAYTVFRFETSVR